MYMVDAVSEPYQSLMMAMGRRGVERGEEEEVNRAVLEALTDILAKYLLGWATVTGLAAGGVGGVGRDMSCLMSRAPWPMAFLRTLFAGSGNKVYTRAILNRLALVWGLLVAADDTNATSAAATAAAAATPAAAAMVGPDSIAGSLLFFGVFAAHEAESDTGGGALRSLVHACGPSFRSVLLSAYWCAATVVPTREGDAAAWVALDALASRAMAHAQKKGDDVPEWLLQAIKTLNWGLWLQATQR